MFPLPLTYLRIGLAALAVMLLVFLGLTVNGWRKDAVRLVAVEAAAEARVQEAQAAVDQMKAAQRAAYEASEGFQNELEELRSRPAVPRVVRVRDCPRLPATPAGTGGPHGARQAAELVPVPVGPDDGVDVTPLLVEADRCSAQLRALQGWVREVSGDK